MNPKPAKSAPDPAALRKRAMGLLARREHSTSELRRKLAQRGFACEDVEAVIAELAAEGLLSDSRYAEAVARSGLNRGFGPVRLRADLGRRGVDSQISAWALRQACADWTKVAIATRRKRFGSAPPDTLHARARQARFLRYRGFTSDQINVALASETE